MNPIETGRLLGASGRRSTGFTFFELMIVVAIVAILAAIALPGYQQAMMKGRRADGTSALFDLTNRMQRYYSDHNTYVGAGTALGIGSGGVASPQGFYTIKISSESADAYTLAAERAGAQLQDSKCGTLTLTSTGVKGMTGGTTTDPKDCW